MGIAKVDIRLGNAVKIENGRACLLGTKGFNLHEILSAADIPEDTFLEAGNTVYSNPLVKICVFYKSNRPMLFHGFADVIINEQYIYSVNNHTFFAFIAGHKTYKESHVISHTVLEFQESNIQVAFERNSRAIYSSNFSNSILKSFFIHKTPYQDTTINQAENLLIMEFPANVPIQPVSLNRIGLGNYPQQLQRTDSCLHEIYSPNFFRLKRILEKYVDIGIPLDIKRELDKFTEAPDFLDICSDFLEEQFEVRQQYISRKPDEHIYFTFRVKVSYNKRFYSSAKLADQAIDIQMSQDKTMYLVTFNGKQIEEMCLMYENTPQLIRQDDEDMEAIRRYLYNHDYLTYLSHISFHNMAKLRNEYGFYSFAGNSVLYSLVNAIHSIRANKLTEAYNEMVREKRVRTKWSSEFKLYALIKEHCSDALYQHRPIWLGQQSFDIYIPSQDVAVEYQGLQHYKTVDLFGGQDALADNLERDARKRKLSAEHGVRVLDWKYDCKITPESVRAFLSEHRVAYSVPSEQPSGENRPGLKGLEMAPVLPEPEKKKPKKSTKRESPFVIRQYSPEGKFLLEYSSVADASTQSGVSAKSINNAIYNLRPLGGGYIWKRCQRESAVEDVAPVQRKENTGLPEKSVNTAQMETSLLNTNQSARQHGRLVSVAGAFQMHCLGRRKLPGDFSGSMQKSRNLCLFNLCHARYEIAFAERIVN